MPELEVHHINVSQGDSTLIVNRDIANLEANIDVAIAANGSLGPKPAKAEDFLPFAIYKKISLDNTVRRAMLIDAGDDVYGEDVAWYLEQQGVTSSTPFFTLATHYHADHVGGFKDVFYKDYDQKKTLSAQTLNLVPDFAYYCGDLPSWDKTGTKEYYRRMTADLISRGTKINEVPLEANDILEDSFWPPHMPRPFAGVWPNLGQDSKGTNINFTVLASNGTVSTDGFGNANQEIDPTKKPDQNARSVVVVLEYGDFRYFLGGDIGGTGKNDGGNFNLNADAPNKPHYSTHPDIETAVTKVLPLAYPASASRTNTSAGHICVHCANHHGSASSNDVFLIEAMKPTVVVCSAGVRLGFHTHPTQQFFQRVERSAGYSPKWQQPGNTVANNPTETNTVDGYYITEMAQNKASGYGSGKTKKVFVRNFPNANKKVMGDVIVRPISEVDFSGKTGAQNIKIQVYGTRLGTDPTVTPNIPLRPFHTVSSNPIYPAGPYSHTCDKH